jgi:bifunctional enzyme CysN/CysC
VAESRDPRGFISQGPRRRDQEFHRHQLAYEPPENPEIVVDTTQQAAEQSADEILDALRSRGIVG